MSLKHTIENQATELATGILRALRTASLDELAGFVGRRPRGDELGLASAGRAMAMTTSGRLGRRSPAQITRVLDQIVGLLQQHPDGLRAEVIKRQLGIDPREVPRPLADGVSCGRIRKIGEKRATTYFAAGAKPVKRNARGEKSAKRVRRSTIARSSDAV
jgi:hypothetical protein